jgi:hypothetical protein
LKIIDVLVAHWKSEDSIPSIQEKKVDLIVPISYTTLSGQLVNATRENLIKAVHWKKYFPRANLAFSNCAYTFPNSAHTEGKFKRATLEKMGITSHIEAGEMNNSIQEARAIGVKLAKLDIHPECILVVTGEMHSPSARLIWERVFPKATILISCTGYRFEYQADHMVKVQRNVLTWFCANIARQMLILIFGLNLVEKMRHNTTAK